LALNGIAIIVALGFVFRTVIEARISAELVYLITIAA